MKALLAILLLLLPSCLLAQEITHDITGIWTGTLSTSEKQLPYEVVISDSSGMLSGYSHITFTVKGKEIIAVKKISVVNEDGIITLEDQDLIDNNFQEVQAKRMKQIATLSLMVEDTIMKLTGSFKTKKIVGERQATGNIVLEKRKPSDTSKLMAKLNQMDLSSSLSFLQLKKETGKVVSEPTAVAQPTGVDNSLASRKIIPSAPPVIQKTIVVPPKDTTAIVIKEPVVKKIPAIIAPKPKDTTVVAVAPVKVTKAPAVVPIKDTTVVAVKKAAIVKTPPVVQPKPKEPVVVAAAPVKKIVKAPVVTPPVQKPVVAVKQAPVKTVAVVTPPVPKPVVVAPPVVHRVVQNQADNVAGAAADISHRQIETIQTLTIESDSIVVTLYDNGYVDGDTVSILLNGKVIMGKVGLSTHPVTKTIYVTEDLGDSLQFVMYAENLGSIPPNTGLMILQDGRKRYEIFFSGDLEKNAAITLRKKRPDLN